LETYRVRWEFTFWPFRVDPYIQSISWSRFDNFNTGTNGGTYPGFSFWLKGESIVGLGIFSTRVLENMKTIEFSVIDTVLENVEFDPEQAWGYDNYFQEDYIDPWWKYDIGKDLLKLSGWYYGNNVFYN
jgi:hypothetical protein